MLPYRYDEESIPFCIAFFDLRLTRLSALRMMRPMRSLSVETQDGMNLFVSVFSKPDRSASLSGRHLFVIHGLGEYGGRYSRLLEDFPSEFDSVYCIDLRGHGRSTGLRGHADSFDCFVDDVLCAHQACKADAERVQKSANIQESHWTLLAHSMGSLVALRLLTRDPKIPFDQVVLSAPFLGVALEVPAWKLKLGKFLKHTLSSLQLSNEVNPSYLSHDPQVVAAYVADRLVHDKCTPKLYFEILDTLKKVHEFKGPLPCPCLFLLAGDDHLVSSPAAKQFYQKLADEQKGIIEYPGFYHELLNELERSRVVADIKNWLHIRFQERGK